MKGASFSLIIKDINQQKTFYSYDSGRLLTPASVMKSITTASALELLGEDFKFSTTIEYDGTIVNGILKGNLYIKGSGDPTLGSKHFGENTKRFMTQWINAIQKAGIHKIEGNIIADESIFDIEGTSLKWANEDMGNYYGAGSYGICVFDNSYTLALQSGAAGTRPKIKGTDPNIPNLHFHNYLSSASIASDSAFISGAPFSTERYLHGAIPANRTWYPLKGDIPDPALFLADYMKRQLANQGISTTGIASCFRLLKEKGKWTNSKHNKLITTYSPTLRNIIKETNHISHNLFADAIIKTIGLRYKPQKGEIISSFNRGTKMITSFWEKKGIDVSGIWIHDGSGLAPANKLSADFVANILTYMKKHSQHNAAFYESLPEAGINGSVRNFLKGTVLQGKARLKSGSMSRVKGYAGYIQYNGKSYAIALFVNNYSCDGSTINQALKKLLLQLFQ